MAKQEETELTKARRLVEEQNAKDYAERAQNFQTEYEALCQKYKLRVQPELKLVTIT